MKNSEEANQEIENNKKRLEQVKAFVRKQNNIKKSPDVCPPVIIIARDPSEAINKKCMKIPAICPCCRKNVEILIPKSILKELLKATKNKKNNTTYVDNIKNIDGKPANG